MSELKEFAVNLPVTTIGVAGNTIPQSAMSGYDITADTAVPPDVSSECKHINVSVDSATLVSYESDSPFVNIDLVLNVNVQQEPLGSNSRNHKVIKRLSMDRVKLALQAESGEYQVVEQEDDPAEVEKMMAEFYAAKRARELVGIQEAKGNKSFNVVIHHKKKSEDNKDWQIKTVKIDNVRDSSHARDTFLTKHAGNYEDVKIKRVSEVE